MTAVQSSPARRWRRRGADADATISGTRPAARPVALVGVLMALAASAYAAYSIQRYVRFEAGGFDLGIFDQVVWHYSRFETPGSSIRGLTNIWGDHFSPILMLLAPLYWVCDDARTLLLAQAVLLAGAAWPIFLYARPRLGDWPAVGLAAGYLVFWGVQSGVGFDFHELAFAPLLGAAAVLAADRERWGWFLAAVVGLLAVKEDQCFVVLALGLFLLSRRQWRPAAACVLLGTAWYVLVIRLLIPSESPSHAYGYFSYGRLGADLPSLFWTCISRPGHVLSTVFSDPTRAHTITLLYVPLLCLPLISRTLIVALPLLAERFLSTTSAYWNTGGHYTLAIAAFLFIGAADGICTVRWAVQMLLARAAPADRRRGRPPREHARRVSADPARPRWQRVAVAGVVAAVVILQVVYASAFPLSNLGRQAFWSTPPAAAEAAEILRAVPAGVSVAAEDVVVTRMAHRAVAAEISPRTGPTDYVVANVLGSVAGISVNGGFAEVSRFVDDHLAGYAPVAWADGWLVLRSRGLPLEQPPAVLTPLTPAVGDGVRRAHDRWTVAFDVTVASLSHCYAAAGRRACYRTAKLPIAGGQANMTRAVVTAARNGISTGCRQLALTAIDATQAITIELEATAAAGARGDATVLQQHVAEFTALQDNADAPGFLTRFVGLCAPS